ncbi:hypothetical protein Cgig2_016929 [Carnegiea gigantea]|uniref:Uncharacterized protein n=1 Tax=Carnegiea gigantea TaxID=171969 RepID=A0A9Q1GT33_9CARY|nr:hypothetical protein Cgig2_016929 [Carnegiea gigantea]
MPLDPVEDDMFVRGKTGEVTCADEWPVSSIMKRVRTLPRQRNPFVMQSSPYLHHDQEVKKGKCKCTNVYIYQKRSKKHVDISSKQLVGANNNVSGALTEKAYFGTSYLCLNQLNVTTNCAYIKNHTSSAGASVVIDVQTLAEEGSQTREISVEDIFAVKETMGATLNGGQEGANEDAVPMESVGTEVSSM